MGPIPTLLNQKPPKKSPEMCFKTLSHTYTNPLPPRKALLSVKFGKYEMLHLRHCEFTLWFITTPKVGHSFGLNDPLHL